MCTARACARVRVVSPYYGCNPKHISFFPIPDNPPNSVTQHVTSGKGSNDKTLSFPFQLGLTGCISTELFFKPHPRWKCGRVKLLDVAFYIIFHNSLTLNNVWSTLWAPVAYNRDLWNGHFAYIYKRSDQTNPVRQDLYFGDCFPKNVSKMRLWGTFILTPCLKCHSVALGFLLKTVYFPSDTNE